MSRQLIVILAALMSAAPPVWAQSPFSEKLDRVSWQDAPRHVGETCVVYGTVVATKNIGSRCFLNFDADYRNSFTVVVGRELFKDFTAPPEELFADKPVEAVGTIVPWQNKTEIVLESAAHIRLTGDKEASSQPAADQTATTPATAPPATAATPPAQPAEPSAMQGALKPAAYKVPADGVIRIATFNVLNLFDDFDDPYVEHEHAAKPSGELTHLARTIHQLDADVLALEEVENRPYLRTFVRTYLADMGYHEVMLIEGNSDRGIDVACLSRFPVEWVRSHRHLDFVDANGNPMRFQRDLLEVHLTPKGYAPLDLYIVHLKSKYGGEQKSLPIRMGEAAAIRDIIDRRLARKPLDLFAICGDFNDRFESKPLRRIVGTGPTALHSFHDSVDASDRITYNRGEHRSMIDFILASPQLAKCYVPNSYAIHYGQVETIGSDHNPVVAAFKLPRQVK